MCRFFFTDRASTEIYTLSLHDALPIYSGMREGSAMRAKTRPMRPAAFTFSGSVAVPMERVLDRKSTRLNSSHVERSYAALCVKKTTLYLPHASRRLHLLRLRRLAQRAA